MAFLNALTRFLSLSQQPIAQVPTHRAFTLEVWLQNSPFNGQVVSMYSVTMEHGMFGIEIHHPSRPLPDREKAVFIKSTANSDSLFAMFRKVPINDGKDARQVFVQPTGELEHAETKPRHEDVYFGNFSTADFTYWPDKKTYDALNFTPPGSGLVPGTFLACPRTVYGQKFYQLLALTPQFEETGCTELDWLVYREVKVPQFVGETVSQMADVEAIDEKEELK